MSDGDAAWQPGGPSSRPAGLGLETPMRAGNAGGRAGLALVPGGRRCALRAGVLAAMLGGLVTLAVVMAAAPASAHTQLTSSTPANGSTVPTAPDKIVLMFAQRLLGLGTVAVDGPGGGSVAVGAAVLDGATVTQALVADRPAGAYRLAYRVVSADGHPVTGEITFTATAATGVPSPAATSTGAAATASATPSVVAAAGGATGPASADGNGDGGGWSTGLTVGVAVGGGVLAAAGGAAVAVAVKRRQGSNDGTT